jgi:hypothetical protein
MLTLTLSFISAVFISLGATLTFDLGGLLLKQVFKIAPSNICLVGRWLRYMPTGTFRHANITAAPRKSGECAAGWIAHYLIGISFAVIFIAVTGSGWLERPALFPALGFGLVTVLAPFLIMQPAFGFGIAASKTPNPGLARLRSLLNHFSFGVGLFLFGWLAHWLLIALI